MLIILAIVIAAAALLIVAYPVLAKARAAQPAASSAQEELAELVARRDAVFQALRDLNFDHQVGKITDGDFVAFEATLKESAADTLAALDQWESATDRAIDAALERAINARRAALLGDGRACPSCDRPAATEDRFCAACGAILPALTAKPAPAVAGVCPQCGRPFDPTDRFCGGCGAALMQVTQRAVRSAG
jgi:hypothetical protein